TAITLPDLRPCETGTLFVRGLFTPVFGDGGRVTHIIHRLETSAGSQATDLERERRLQKLIENNYDAIILTDLRGTLIFASPGIERITGYTPEEYLARPAGIDTHPEDAVRVGNQVRAFLAQGGKVLSFVARRKH